MYVYSIYIHVEFMFAIGSPHWYKSILSFKQSVMPFSDAIFLHEMPFKVPTAHPCPLAHCAIDALWHTNGSDPAGRSSSDCESFWT